MCLYGIAFRNLINILFIREENSAFIIDETFIQIIMKHYYLLCMAIKPLHKTILGIHISKKKNMFVARQFLQSLQVNMAKIVFILMVVLGIQKFVQYSM